MDDRYTLKFTHRPTGRPVDLTFYADNRKEQHIWRDLRGALEGDMNFENVRIVTEETTEVEVEL